MSLAQVLSLSIQSSNNGFYNTYNVIPWSNSSTASLKSNSLLLYILITFAVLNPLLYDPVPYIFNPYLGDYTAEHCKNKQTSKQIHNATLQSEYQELLPSVPTATTDKQSIFFNLYSPTRTVITANTLWFVETNIMPCKSPSVTTSKLQ